MAGTVNALVGPFLGPSAGDSLCDVSTDWSASGITIVGIDTEIKVQGTGCLAFKVSNATGYAIFPPSAPVNLTATMIYFWAGFFDPIGRLNTFAGGGLGLKLRSGVGNTRGWYLAGRDTWSGAWKAWGVHTSATPTGVEEAGTFDIGAVDQVMIRWSTTTAAKISPNAAIDAVRYLTVTQDAALALYAGTEGSPATIQDYIDKEEFWDGSTFPNRYGVIARVDGIPFCQGRLRIGHASLATYYKDLNEVLVFKETVAAAPDDYYRLKLIGNASQATQIYLGQKVGGAGLSGLALRAGGAPSFQLDATDANLTELGIYGTALFQPAAIALPVAAAGREIIDSSFVEHLAITLGTIAINRCSFISGAGLITSGGGVFTNCLVAGPPVAVAMGWNVAVDPNGKLDGTTFISSGTGHAIEFGTSTPKTISLTDVTFSGYGAGETTDAAIYNNSGAGLLTINILGSGTTPTVRNGAGASTTVVSGQTSVTFTGLKDNTEVRVYNASTGAEIAGIENAIDGTPNNRSFAWSAAASTVVDYVIHHVSYETIRVNDYTVPASNVSLPIQQRLDRNYENL